ncbi:MAG: C39 family peptidase [Patescibacteria group bacterium]
MFYEKRKILFLKILAVLCVISTIGIFDYWLWAPKSTPTVKPSQNEFSENKTIATNEEAIKSIQKTEEETKKIENQEIINSQINFDVPFTSQAPFAVWDDLHNEACEEAALIMAKYWLNGEKLSPEKAEKEILASVNWQIKNWGGHYDLPAEKIVELGKEFFNFKKIRTFYNPSVDDIKKELSKGNLVLTPAAGRLLKNPYYRQPGPVYHLLVVRGYDEKGVITNDPGTRRGKGFRYTWDNFFGSLHDWLFGPPDYGQKLSKDEKAVGILRGQKVMIVIEK